VTGIYRGKVSRQYPWVQRDGHWQPLENQPYPVVSLADAGPDFDHTGLEVLVIANPDHGDHADLLAEADGRHRPDSNAICVWCRCLWPCQVASLATALRATLAQRDEARARVAELEALPSPFSLDDEGDFTWLMYEHPDGVRCTVTQVDCAPVLETLRALVSPPTAGDDQP
jgi:hypothetical protein